MGHFYVLLGLGALMLLAFGLSVHRRLAPRYRLPYRADRSFFSPEQWAFLNRLDRVLGPDYRVFGRVRALDVIGLRPRLDRGSRQRAYARLGERQFDFLVCEARSGAIVCAITLAPPSRLRRGPPRDALDRICAAAGLPLVRFRAGQDDAEPQVRERVRAALAAARPRPAPAERRAPEPPNPEAETVLSSLAATLREEGRVGDGRTRRGAWAAAAPVPVGAKSVAPPEWESDPRPVPRTEPTLSVPTELDSGPKFRIDAALDLEEEAPRRRRGARS